MNIVHILLALGVVLLGIDLGADVDGDLLVWLGTGAAVVAAIVDVSDRGDHVDRH